MGAAQSLGDLADVKAVTPLIDTLQDREPGVRSEAATALGQLNDSQATVPLIEILADPEEGVRRVAIKALTAIGRQATEPLILALNKSDNITQVGAAQALGQIGEEKSAEPLIWAFKNGDGPVRQAAVMALARINRSLAVSPFIQLLGDSNVQSDLRADAAWALGEMNDDGARVPLISAMANDKDSGVRMSAAQALKSIGNTNVPVYSI
jgi:HEAT repeat protein